MEQNHGLVATLMDLPIFQAEWVLWVLIALSLGSVAVMVERFAFYRRRAIDISAVRARFGELLDIYIYSELLNNNNSTRK